MATWIERRAQLMSWLDRSGPARRATAQALATAARRRGADHEVIETALAGVDDRPATETAQMIRWASALAGTAPAPRHFRPAEHLDDATIERLRGDNTLATADDPHLTRQLWSLRTDRGLDELREDIQQRLPHLLRGLRPAHSVANTADAQLEAIATITAALRPHGHLPFLVSGTLLGVVRDGAPMASDYDVDLGLLPGDGTPDDIAALLTTVVDSVDVRPGRLVIVTAEHVKVDLFFHHERDDRYWHHTEIHEWWNTPFLLTETVVAGRTMWVPDEAERYLVENYGDGWKAPTAFYDMSFDTPNRRYLRTAVALDYLVRRTMIALEQRDRWTYEAGVQALRESFGIDPERVVP